MTAKDIMSPLRNERQEQHQMSVDSDLPVMDVLSRLLESPTRELDVTESGEFIGHIDQNSMLEGLGRMITPRDDCSVITVECAPENYSASIIAHAIEDTDAHLVDLMSFPSDNGKIRVTLRLRNTDPTSAARNLEGYDYEVVEIYGHGDLLQSVEIATERLLSLQALMNV